VALLGAAVFATMALQAGQPAAGDQADSGLEPIGVLVPDDELDPRILRLDLSGGGYDRATDELESALFDREAIRRELDQVSATSVELAERSVALTADIAAARRTVASTGSELERLETQLAVRAVERFVQHGTDVEATLDPKASIDAGREAHLSTEVDEAQLHDRSDLITMIADTEATLERLETALFHTRLSTAVTAERLARLQDELVLSAEAVTVATGRVVSSRRNARVAWTGIPVVAMDAYLDAETTLAEADPGCRLAWWMVAGVARVESVHGEIGGRQLRADGTVDSPIIGVVLDGGSAVQLVADTDGGHFDQDPSFDRAVGPLQFIPETWGRLGRDGNDDGVIDPQNIHDAALSAGTYLCRLGSDLSVGSELRGAYFGYNGSSDYVDDVAAHALRYSALELA
jgi:membrane-bound lytic murein transglycosylase B